jgi:galactokinase
VNGFQDLYGTPPEGVWAAPGRVNLIGEHTDYNDGLVLPLALPHTTVVAAARRTDGLLALHSADRPGPVALLPLDTLVPGAATGWAAYPAGVAWALAQDGHDLGGGASLAIRSTVPVGAGLSSSAALELSAARALNDLHGLGLDARRLALAGRRAENDFAGVPCGVMDQLASACCRAGHALRLDTRDLAIRHIPFDPAAAGLRLLVADTGVTHDLADSGYADRRAGCAAAAAALGLGSLRELEHDRLDRDLARLPGRLRPLVRHVVTENRRVDQVVTALDAGRIRDIGPLLTAGHRSLRDDFAVSCAELDTVVDAATAAGALGARMTGGGFGGSAVLLTEATAVPEVGEAVRVAARAAGHPEPSIFEAVPSAGARRLA